MAMMKGGMSRATGQSVELAPGRAIVGDRRFSGCVQDWTSNGYGWIVPLEAVPHPAAKKRSGRIYVEQRDVRGSQALEVGANVDFILYADVRGLGAVEVELAAEDPAEAQSLEAGEDVPLPAGWEKVWSDEQEQFYYWHQASKESSWAHPAGLDRTAEERDEGCESLPPHWEKHYDEESESWYYWNCLSKESSWDRPESAQSTTIERPADAVGTRAHSSRSTASGDVEARSTRVHARVTSWQTIHGWMVPIGSVGSAVKGLIDSHGGKIFLNWRDAPGIEVKLGTELDCEVYVDEKGLCAADVRPIDERKTDAGFRSKGAGKGKRGKGKGKADNSADPLVDLERQWAKQDKKLGVSPAVPAKRTAEEMEAGELEEPSVDGPLMPGWEQHWSEEHNCYYYWHAATKQSTWDRPLMPTDAGEDYGSRVPGTTKSAPKMATPMTPLQSRAAGSSITPITAMPRRPVEQGVAHQPLAPPPGQWTPQNQKNHGNRPIVPVWQQQAWKRGRY